MIDTFLVPEKTIATATGDGPAVLYLPRDLRPQGMNPAREQRQIRLLLLLAGRFVGRSETRRPRAKMVNKLVAKPANRASSSRSGAPTRRI